MPEFRITGDRKGPGKSKLGAQKSIKEQVNKHEQQLAEDLGGYRQPNSGAMEGRKGDIQLEDFLLESKETDTQQLVLHAKDVIKINREAREVNREPALVLTLKKVPSTCPTEWVAVPKAVFIKMLERLYELQGSDEGHDGQENLGGGGEAEVREAVPSKRESAEETDLRVHREGSQGDGEQQSPGGGDGRGVETETGDAP